jgi:hypothetical protein
VDRFLFDDYLDEQERIEVRALVDQLEDRAEFLEEELEKRELTRQQAEELFSRVIGLMRAIDELQHLDDEDEWEDRHRSVMEEVEDIKRWQDFTKRVYKKDEYY